MADKELDQRRAGFISALNLLAASGDPALVAQISAVLRSHGADLYKEIETPQAGHSLDLSEANPCPPGYYWDPIQQLCVPNENDGENN